MGCRRKEVAAGISVMGLVGLFATCFLYMADLSFYPIFGTLVEEYPDAGMTTLNLAMTGSQVSVLVASFAVVPLMRRFSKKSLLLVSVTVFAVFACSCQFVGDVRVLALFRTLSGLGFGATYPLAVALINERYRADGPRRDQLVGWMSGMMGVAGVINSLMAGILASIAWNWAFAWYWVAVPVFVLIVAFVPATSPEGGSGKSAVRDDGLGHGPARGAGDSRRAVAQGRAVAGVTVAQVLRFLVMLIAFVLVNVGWYDLATQLSVYLPEHFAWADASTCGLFQTIGTVGSAMAGFVFAPCLRKLGRLMPATVFGCLLACYLAYAFVAPLPLLGLGLFLAGVAYAFGMAYYMVRAASILPAEWQSAGMALVSAAMALGGFVAPFAVTWLETLLDVGTVTAVYPVLVVVMAVACVVSVATGLSGVRVWKRHR